MNIAILGPGGIADDQHAPAVLNHPDATLWSVLSRSAERAEAFSKKHGLNAPAPAHTNLAELLADPLLDAVIIATPDRLHSTQVLAAARAGKHILLEKPMATSVSECEAMIEACRTNGVTLAMAYHLRWHRGHRLIRQQVSSGALGALRHMRVHFTFQAPRWIKLALLPGNRSLVGARGQRNSLSGSDSMDNDADRRRNHPHPVIAEQCQVRKRARRDGNRVSCV